MAENPRYRKYDVGVGTYGYPEVVFYDAGATLRIGKYCSVAPMVRILLGGEHHHDWVSSYPFSLMFDEAKDLEGYPFSKGDVNIGNDVWIGYDAIILSGVSIGDGAVVGARSVVTKDVKPFEIVAGTPARHIRKRFADEHIEGLCKIAWWNWSDDQIRSAWHLIQSPNVEEFITRYLPAA